MNMYKNDFRASSVPSWEEALPATWIEKWKSLWSTAGHKALMRHVPHALYLVLLGVVYIGNRHHIDRLIQRTEKIKLEVEDRRADYMQVQSAYMLALTQAKFVHRAKKTGFEESRTPPYVIIVKEP